MTPHCLSFSPNAVLADNGFAKGHGTMPLPVRPTGDHFQPWLCWDPWA